ncbi:MAG: hypothetical protein ACI4MF_11320 [Candidatus Faecivicinus sp.]
MNKQRIRNVICIVLVVCYVSGLLCMFLNALEAGLALWVVSTVGGMVALFHIRNGEEKAAAKEAARKAEKEDDPPCE